MLVTSRRLREARRTRFPRLPRREPFRLSSGSRTLKGGPFRANADGGACTRDVAGLEVSDETLGFLASSTSFGEVGFGGFTAKRFSGSLGFLVRPRGAREEGFLGAGVSIFQGLFPNLERGRKKCGVRCDPCVFAGSVLRRCCRRS